MKFLKFYYQSILSAFEQCGYTKEDFHFVKRKGRIITQPRFSQSTFSFFLRKTVELDPETQDFIKILLFEVKDHNNGVSYVDTWDEVVERYELWLKSL